MEFNHKAKMVHEALGITREELKQMFIRVKNMIEARPEFSTNSELAEYIDNQIADMTDDQIAIFIYCLIDHYDQIVNKALKASATAIGKFVLEQQGLLLDSLIGKQKKETQQEDNDQGTGNMYS